MELVTLAHVTLNRVGSASSRGMMARHQPFSSIQETVDNDPATLRALIVELAEKHGETPGSLARLEQLTPYEANQYTPTVGAVVFNVQGANVSYGSPYAVCLAFPALRVGGRYFKLDEVDGVG